MPKSLSIAALTVLHAVASGTAYGFDIIDATDLPGGTVYPALARMERDGLLRSDWEDEKAAHAKQRPARRIYAITTDGVRVLQASLEKVRALRPIPNLRGVRPAPSRGRS